MTIAIILLFIVQLVCFYLIALLYMRMNKVNDVEAKQQRLMAEMDDTIAAYLHELKDENDRLINLLESRDYHASADGEVKTERQGPVEEVRIKPVIPVKKAMQTYSANMAPKKAPSEEPVDDRSLAVRLHEEGRSIEEIARKLGKGKTEIELILKFK